MTAPQTGFEDTGSWTTAAAETAFLTQVAGETTATLSEAGRTVENRPIHRVDLGTGPTMAIVALQHGNEPASREALLQLIRDLAYSADPAVMDYLSTRRLVAITNANVDRLATTRSNANGINLNRDWWKLTQPETRAVHQVIIAAQASVVVDAHEYFSEGADWLAYPAGMPGTHPALQALADTAYLAGESALTAIGRTAGYYGISSLPWAGLSTGAAARHAVGLLSETNAHGSPADRVQVQRLVMGALIAWHDGHAEEADAARTASIAHAKATREPVAVQTREYIGGGPIATADVAGYTLADPLPHHLIAAHGIAVDDATVTIHQPARLAVAALCDPESTQHVVDATRIPRIPPGRWIDTLVMTPAGRRRVTQAWHHDGARPRPITLPSAGPA